MRAAGAGAVAWRFRCAESRALWPVLRNVYFDTCVYHQPGVDLLLEVIPADHILFASEMVGAVHRVGTSADLSCSCRCYSGIPAPSLG